MDTPPNFLVDLVSPLFLLLIPHSRFFWLHLLSALLIALAFCYWRQPAGDRRSLRAAFRAVFPKRILCHPSALVDYRFAIINHLLQVALYGSLIANTVVLTGWSVNLLELVFGSSAGTTATAGPLASVLFTLCTLLAVDGGLFFAHWLQHKVPLLWTFHKVHHSAEVLTPVTVLRMHPVDVILNALTTGVLLAGANGVFLYLYGGPVTQVTVIGANALTFLFFIAGYHLRHSHVWIMFPRGVREHISSPALHHIHHSANPKHFDKNFARVFTFWDRLAGTLYIPATKEDLTFGLSEPEQRELTTVWQLYISPFREAYRRYAPGIRRRTATVD